MTGYAMFVEGWNAAIMWLLRHDSPTLRMAGDTMMRDASTQDAWLGLLRRLDGDRVHEPQQETNDGSDGGDDAGRQ